MKFMSKKILITITIIVIVAMSGLMFFSNVSLKRAPDSGIIVDVNDSFATVRLTNGEIKIYPIPDRDIVCSVDDAWPDCLPAF